MSRVPYVLVGTSLAGRPAGTVVPLADSERHHLERVLRLRPGAGLEVADGAGSWAPADLGAGEVRLSADAVTLPRPTPALEVAQALGKGRKLDEVVRAVTELGADAVVPVAATRSVARLDPAAAPRAIARWRAVARAACEQSRRPRLPEIRDVTATPDLATGSPSAGTGRDTGSRLLVADRAGVPLPDCREQLVGATTVTVAVGPEGGFTDAEVAHLVDHGALRVGLGPGVLRTEHAAMAAVAVLGAMLGRW